MKTIYLIIFFLVFIIACNNESDSLDNGSFEWLIDSMTTIGYKQFANCKLPNGISDTLILGYTDRTKKYFYNKELKLKTLRITGIRFDKKEKSWKQIQYFYRFDFDNKKEEKKFLKFQKLCLNYQKHNKNFAEFFMRDTIWHLSFKPMP